MARVIEVGNGATSLHPLIQQIARYGRSAAPRGLPTLELRNVIIEVFDPYRPLARGVNRGLNERLAALEALQLIAGVSDPGKLVAVSSKFKDFLDGGVLHGPYGPRLASQMPAVIERLQRDEATRQAVATIWDPIRDLHTPGMRDYPCTVYISWHIRNGFLYQTTHMRSNDVWWGWTYDVVQFTQLQITIANILGLGAGAYTHFTDSLHLYEHDLEAASQVSELPSMSPCLLDGIEPGLGGSWPDAADRAYALLYDEDAINNLEPLSYFEKWAASLRLYEL